MIIKTKIDNLYLKTINTDNLGEKLNLIIENRKFLTKWLKWPNYINTEEDVLEYTKKMQIQMENNEKKVFCIYLEDAYIGQIDLQSIDVNNKSCEIGYWLGEKYNGKGYMIESVEAILNYIFNNLGFCKVYIYIDPLNYKSLSIPKKLGFSKLDGYDEKYEVYIKTP